MGTTTDPAQVLGGIFLGTKSAAPAFEGVVTGEVVSSTATTVRVTIDNFDPSGKSAWDCTYEKRLGASPATPPAGTKCLLAFPSNDPTNTPWVVAFTAWP